MFFFQIVPLTLQVITDLDPQHHCYPPAHRLQHLVVRAARPDMHQLEHKLHCNLLHFHWNQTLITISCTRGTLCLTAGHFLLLLNSPASVLIKTTCTWKRVVCEWFVMGLSLSPTRDVTLRFSKFASTSPFPASFWATSQGQKLKRDISKSSEKIKFSNHEIKNRKISFHMHFKWVNILLEIPNICFI